MEATNEIAAALAKAQAEMNPEKEAAAILALEGYKFQRSGRQHERKPLMARILDRVRCGATDCWHWCGPQNGKGYGRMTYEGRSQMAHRLSWIAVNGPIPEGLYVLHRCDNRLCVNPEHLWLGTYSDNMKDCWAKGRNPGRRGKGANRNAE